MAIKCDRPRQRHRLLLAVCLASILFAGALPFGRAAYAAPDDGWIRGLQPIDAVLPWYDPDGNAVSNAIPKPMEGLELILSKFRYPADDGHLDAVIRLKGDPAEAASGRIEVALLDQAGTVLGHESIAPLPGRQIFFSVPLPDALAGSAGSLRATWTQPGEPPASDEKRFEVAAPENVAQSGRVALTVPNDSGASARAVPFTVGVPFPRGVLRSAENVRLLDEQGREVPLEARETARWSRYGSVKWVLCEFAADMDGRTREFALEYGPGVRRSPTPGALRIEERPAGFPLVRAGLLEARDTGLYFDATGQGAFRRVLLPEALLGGYVEHEDGRVYRMVPDQPPTVEVPGEQQAILMAEGYYVEAESGRQFCRYKTRYFFHQGSPLLRIAHTWVFTGDSGRDRIADMGWRFPLAEGVEPEGFLRSFSGDDWAQADYVLQHDYNLYDVASEGEVERDAEGRLPGVMAASDGTVRLVFGARDFWQNFPAELGAAGGALTFHNWPRHGRARRHSPATLRDAFRLWFAHEGEMLDLSLPDEFAQNPIWRAIHNNIPYERHWMEGRPEQVNAQGVARTEEMWLLFAPAQEGAGQAARTLEGLNEETLRAVADPAWVAASGALHEIRHRDAENFPAHEETYETIALAPARWTEQLGHYGKWIYGDYRWEPRLWQESAGLYRSLRKAHHFWPYSWLPFARSGDARLLRLAHAGTRQMYDANMCHYYTAEVDAVTGPERTRRRGMWTHGTVPWQGRIRGAVTRSYQGKCDYLWHAYYLTGDRRALDAVHMLWAEEMKVDEPLPERGRVTSPRWRQALWKGAVDMYEAIHDPWHLVFAHTLAEAETANHLNPAANYSGHTWEAAEWAFLRFTGCPAFRAQVALRYARAFGSENYGRWGGQSQVEPNALGWWQTGEEHFLRRVAHELDWAGQSHFRGEPDYYRGFHLREGTGAPLYTSWFLRDFPIALAVLAAAGEEPLPVPNRFWQAPEAVERIEGGHLLRMPLVAFRKQGGQPLPLSIAVSLGDTRPERWPGDFTGHYRVFGPDGGLVLEGSWDMRRPHSPVVLPAEAPGGTYWLEVTADVARIPPRRWPWRFLQGIRLPVTPAGTPEVMVPQRPAFGRSIWEAQYWFLVPEDAERLDANFFVLPHHSEVRRMSLWNADMEMVWDHNIAVFELGEREELTVAAQVEVPAEQRGRLWRATLPGRSSGFEIRSEVKPVFSVSADRWFDPGERPELGD